MKRQMTPEEHFQYAVEDQKYYDMLPPDIQKELQNSPTCFQSKLIVELIKDFDCPKDLLIEYIKTNDPKILL